MNADKSVSAFPITIRTGNAKSISSLSKLFQGIKFIQLETNDTFLIGRIDKLLFSKNSIFILDANKARCIFVYDNQGSALKKYKSVGKGPQEYIQLYDMSLKSGNDNLLVLADAQKVIELTRNLEFVSENRLGFRGYCFASVNKFNFNFQSETQTGELIITDSSFNIEKKNFILNNFKNAYSGIPFSNFRNRIFFTRFRCDTVFEIEDKSVTPARILELEAPGSLFRYDESDTLCLIQTNSSMIFYFKNTGSVFEIDKNTIDDYFFLPFRSMRYLGIHDGKLIASIEPFDVLKNIELIRKSCENSKDLIHNAILKLVDGSSASSNPIILLIDIKQPIGL